MVLNWPILKAVLGPGGLGKIVFINRVLLLKGEEIGDGQALTRGFGLPL